MRKLEEYVLRDQKRMRCGYTTGSCAAGAAKAATEMLLSGGELNSVTLPTPKGILLTLDVQESWRDSESVTCAVQKDSGDDPDVTDGILVFATVRRVPEGILVDGGKGVGRVTCLGLACAVGEAAINPTPRRMITEAVREICEKFNYSGGISVVISIPAGEELARRTYNPRLGIMGGISVLGTTGIVEPMSERGLIDSIHVEMDVVKAAGVRCVVITPGNYGSNFTREHTKIDLSRSVKCSNYVGEILDYAALLEFEGALLIGHIGKFVKLAGGIMNTHSHVADARLEILTAHAALHGAGTETVRELMRCVTTDEAIQILDQAGLREQTVASIMKKIQFHIKARVPEKMRVGAIMFSNRYGVLGSTAEVDQLLPLCERCRE